MKDRGLGEPIVWDENDITRSELYSFENMDLSLGMKVEWRGEYMEITSINPLRLKETGELAGT